MKALSVMQPWAFLIAAGQKTIELRTWQTDHRGDLLICASRTEQDVYVQSGDDCRKMPVGVMQAVVSLDQCRPATADDADAACADDIPNGMFAWVMSNPRHPTHAKVSGRLRLFDVPDSAIAYMSDDDDWLASCAPGVPGKNSIVLNAG